MIAAPIAFNRSLALLKQRDGIRYRMTPFDTRRKRIYTEFAKLLDLPQTIKFQP